MTVTPAIDPGPLLGDWVAFAPSTGLTRIRVEEKEGGTSITAEDWGEAPARVFAGDVDGGDAWGFRGSYDRGSERVELFAYVNRGLLVVEAATTPNDVSSGSPHYVRYMFHRAEGVDE